MLSASEHCPVRAPALWLAGCACVAAVLAATAAGCASSPLNSKVDQSFLKKVAKDPFPSAAERGILPPPQQ